MKALLILAAIALISCDSVVKTEMYPQRARIESGTDSCTHPGYCMCSYNKFRFSYCLSCPGHEDVTHRITPYKATHESGKVSYEVRVETISVEKECH